MRRYFAYAMLLIGMFMFTACPSDDDEDENNGKKPQNTVVEPGVFGRVRVTSTGKINIYYRDDGTIESVSGYHFSEDQKILSREAGDGIHTWELTYNKQGLVSTITYTHPKKSFYSYTATCTYNNNRLIKIDHATLGGSGVIDLVWEDDCIVAGGLGLNKEGSANGYRHFYTYTHSKNEFANKYRQYSHIEAELLYDDVYEALAYLGLLGLGSAYLPNSYESAYADRSDLSFYPGNSSFTFNDDGTINSWIERHANGEKIMGTYTYKSIYY